MLLGRQSLVIQLTRLALEGETVLIYGRKGTGKTAVLEAVESEIRRSGRACSIAHRTEVLADVVDALAECYPDVSAPNRLATRARLRAAVREFPAVLLLDHLAATTAPVRSYLRTLRGTGLGVILAANVEHARDRAQVRSLRLAYREIEVPPLEKHILERVLDAELEKRPPERVLAPSERARLLEVAGGRPGVVALLLELLDRTTPTGEGRIHWELLRCEVSSAIAGAYARSSPESKLELAPKEESGCRSRARGSGSAST
jgi:hypothetical protein